MRIEETWPKGHGVDFGFWNRRALWFLSDAAAISLGVDPRVCYDDTGTKDPAFHGGPKLAENQVPGLATEIENLGVMARNGLFPTLKDGVNDENPRWWYVRPSDFQAFMGKGQEDVSIGLAKGDLSQKSRTSYLVVIAALCEKSNIKWRKEGAAGKIRSAVETIGASMSENTIRKILKEIPDAVETRS